MTNENEQWKLEGNCNLEIIKLKKMLKEAKIPFEYIYLINRDKIYPAHQIIIKGKTNKILCDAVQNFFSYGNEKDLIEIRGALTEEENEMDCVLGYLSAKEVFKRFKYCYEHNTSVYRKEEN